MRECRESLEQFLVDLLEPVGRSERRHWGSVYVRGLLLDGERKSIEPIRSAFARRKRAGVAAVRGTEPVGMGAGVGTAGKANESELEPNRSG